jgi:spermidine/putrescine transport system substrate-binding protein
MSRWMLAAVVALAAAVAGCGTDETGAKSEDEQAPVVKKGPVKGQLTISQWPLYIDPGKKGSVAEFEKATGVDVKYVEEINDNDQFYGKLRPQLESGDTGGRSLIVVSDWLAARMDKLGYLQHFDYSKLPNVKQNLLPALRNPAADPKRAFTVPWQSGMTGLIVRTDLAPGVDEIADIFDPKYKGKVTMLTELRDTVPMTLKSMGIDPDTASQDEWLSAVDKVAEAADSGQIRRFTGNDYIKDLPKGDSHLVFGWSGDGVQLEAENKDIQFFFPPEGVMLWADNMQIPVGAPNPYTAELMMNFVYDPEIQARIAAYINYVTPVRGVKEVIARDDPKVAESQLIFPDDATLEKTHIFKSLEPEEEQELDGRFQEIIGA